MVTHARLCVLVGLIGLQFFSRNFIQRVQADYLFRFLGLSYRVVSKQLGSLIFVGLNRFDRPECDKQFNPLGVGSVLRIDRIDGPARQSVRSGKCFCTLHGFFPKLIVPTQIQSDPYRVSFFVIRKLSMDVVRNLELLIEFEDDGASCDMLVVCSTRD